MTRALCIALALPPARAGTAAVAVDEHLALAQQTIGDDLVVCDALHDPSGGPPGAIVATRGGRRDLESVVRASPLGADYRQTIAGCDPETFGGTHARSRQDDEKNLYVEIAVDTTDPPVPFDDPAVLQIFRSQLASNLPLLGTRYVACAALFADGVRARGSITAMRAESPDVARWLALADPWRRLATTWLFTIRDGIFAPRLPAPGPGIQRSATFTCAPTRSTPEPAINRPGAADRHARRRSSPT